MQKRIWELDALRGIAILMMVAVHFVYDFSDIFPFADSNWFYILKQWGGYIFVVLSGICATLGSRPVKRGLTVFLCGMFCTAVTVGMYLLGMAGKSICIWFGALHCLGACMMLWPLFRNMSNLLLAVCGITAIAVGWVCEQHIKVMFPWLVPLGITYPGFATADYFPLISNFGVFLLGSMAGRLLYPRKQSLWSHTALPAPMRFLCACGRHSLWIYLLHQPVISIIGAFV